MVCMGPSHSQEFWDSVSRGCASAGAGQYALLEPLCDCAPLKDGHLYLRPLIQPVRLWKGPWIFYYFKANPPCLAMFGMEELRNEGVPSADPLSPKACLSHGNLGRVRVRVCCLQPP